MTCLVRYLAEPWPSNILTLMRYLSLLILLAGDIETNPGPRRPKYPCGECHKACTSYRGAKASILCNTCDSWFHADCAHISDEIFDTLGRTDLPWECCKCGVPNLSTSLFDTILVGSEYESSSISSCLSATRLSSVDSEVGSPIAQSSPSKPDTVRKLPSTLRSLVINFQSVFKKREEFWCLVDATKPDIIIGSETWLNPEKGAAEFFPPNYSLYRKDRIDGYGGVLLGIHSSLISQEVSIVSTAEFIAVKLSDQKDDIIIGAAYRPTNNDQVYMDALNQAIVDLCDMHPGSPVWIGSDFNLPDINWEHEEIVSYQYLKSINETFLQTIARTGLNQLVDFPTRLDNTLDLVITNRPSLSVRCEALPGLSDHEVVLQDMKVHATRQRPNRHKILLWNRVDFDQLRSEAKLWAEEFVNSHTTSTPVEQLADNVQSSLEKLIKDHVPSKLSTTRFNQPWFNSSVKRMTRRKKRAFKKARRTKKDRDWLRYRRLKKATQQTCRQAYSNYINDMLSSDPGGNKKLGALVKSKRRDQSGVSHLKDGNLMHSDPKSKANILNRQFASVFTNEDQSDLPDLGSSPHPTMDDITVSCEGVAKLLRNLKAHKAAGPDGLPARLLKETASEIAPAVTLLFQASIDQGSVPSTWKKAMVVPLFKKGSRSSAANYRPISLTAILCKLCEHILHCAVIRHLTAHNILSDAQHGFRSQRSCDTQLLLTIHDLAK